MPIWIGFSLGKLLLLSHSGCFFSDDACSQFPSDARSEDVRFLFALPTCQERSWK